MLEVAKDEEYIGLLNELNKIEPDRNFDRKSDGRETEEKIEDFVEKM